MPARIENLLDHTHKQPEGCWLWKGRTKRGYGLITRDGITTPVHNLVYRLHVAPLKPGQVVRHLCNTKLCIRPDHLKAGTQQENVLDSVRAGTHKNPVFPGERNPQAAITEDVVRRIRKKHCEGRSRAELAREFGLGYWHVRDILTRKLWKHVE